VTYLPSSYNPWVVAASLLIASFASYVALDLAKRVRTQDRGVALSWWIGGSTAMGSGIWCMHFIGMLAFSLPIALGYTVALTFASWLAGIAVSAVALFVFWKIVPRMSVANARVPVPLRVAGSAFA